MADAFSVNERVPTNTSLYIVWRLSRVLLSAGWTLVQSGNGTSFGASDYWTTFASVGTSSWIVLAGPGGRQLCFWRNTTSTEAGKIIYERTPSGFTFSGASAATPGAISATATYVRGSSGTFNTWFGASSLSFPVRWLSVCAKDVADGSFWLIGTSPQAAGTTTIAYHTFGFFSLYPASSGDTEPYVFYFPANSATADTLAGGGAAGDTLLADAELYWYGWTRGAGSWTWAQLRPAPAFTLMAGGQRDPYTAGYPYGGCPVVLGRTTANNAEIKGYLKYVRSFTWNERATVFHSSTGPYRWVGVGSANAAANTGCAFFWDGKTPIMALEY